MTKDAVKKAKNAGYDDELFHSVYWAQFPEMVKLALNTGNGKFQVTYMVGNIGSLIIVGSTSLSKKKMCSHSMSHPARMGSTSKSMMTLKLNKDKVTNFHFADNAETGKAGLSAMYCAIEVIPTLPADSRQKLASQWAKIKKNRS